MRLTEEQRLQIRRLAAESFGDETRVSLFGSRTDDMRRGGDVDLLVEVAHVVPSATIAAARLAARIERALGGRSTDVLLVDPSTHLGPVHRAALRSGVPV